jgi:ComF family protein
MKYLSVDKIKNFTKNLLFPAFCLGCQREGTFLCQDCQHLLEISEYNYCLCEKNPLRLFPNQSTNQAIRQAHGKCPKCQDNKLSGLYFALPYKEKSLTKKLIRNFKYKPYIKDLSKPLAKILVEHFILTNKNTNIIWDNSVLVPVPLYIKKQKERGYNQSEELCYELSKILKVPVVSDCLIKIKNTEPQMKLKKAQRENNLTNAFTIKNPAQVAGKKVFLVDDVYTTGSTMQECASVLNIKGVKQVWGISIAREEFL